MAMAMAHRGGGGGGGGGSRSAYYFFVRDRLPELQRRGLPLARVADAIPYCSEEWALLTEEEKMKYTEMARKWKENKFLQKPVRECHDRYRINWCLRRMASLSGIESHLELLNVEDLIVELYWKKYQKEPSKTWVCKELDVFLWDYSSNTRCKWHEENDILFCALASCKKIAYCISKSLASVYGVSLTAAHLPLEDCDSHDRTNARMVVLDAGRFQKMKARSSGCDSQVISPSQDQGFVPSACGSPCGVKTPAYGTSTMRGRGIAQLLKSASHLTNSLSN